MRKQVSLVIALAATLMGAVSAQAQITWTRQTSGYPTLSHTDGRAHLPSWKGTSAYTLTGAFASTPSSGTSWLVDTIQGVGSAGELSGFPSGGLWTIDVFSSAAAMAAGSLGDLGHGVGALVGSPTSFGTVNFLGNSREAFFITLDFSSAGIVLPSNISPLFQVSLDQGTGTWGWNESDISSGFGSDLVKVSSQPGQIFAWTDFNRPTGVAGLDVGFTQAVPEPSTIVLMISGLASFAARRRRLQKR